MGRQTFGACLSAWLQQHALSQSDLARRVGTTQATISRYVDGTQFPTLPLAVRLQAVTGIPMALMTRQKRPTR